MFGGDQRVIGDGDHASAGIALGISKRVELFEVDLSHSGFFAQLAHRGLVETFVFKNKAALCWKKYAELSETLEPTAIESEIRRVIAEHAEHLLIGLGT